MGSVSIWHWVVVGIIVMLLFGRGKVSDLMGDVAKGIKSFKKGMADDEPLRLLIPLRRLSPFRDLLQRRKPLHRQLRTSIKPVNWFNVRIKRPESRLLLDV